jgi:hypothetical protein
LTYQSDGYMVKFWIGKCEKSKIVIRVATTKHRPQLSLMSSKKYPNNTPKQ